MMQRPDARYRLSLDHPLLAALGLKPKFSVVADSYQSSAKAGIIRVHNAYFFYQILN
jgi:hypothetical protein